MVTAKLMPQDYIYLKSFIGQKLLSFECGMIDDFKRTYGNIRLNFESDSIEICNEQKPLAFYDSTEDVAYFELKKVQQESAFDPYIPSETSQKYSISKKVQSIEVIEDTIVVKQDNFAIQLDMAIKIITDQNFYIFSKGLFFDEHIYITENQSYNDIYPEEQLINDWSDGDDPSCQISLKRTTLTL